MVHCAIPFLFANMNNRSRFYLLIIVTLLISACSAVEETSKIEKQKEPEVFVFDDVKKSDTINATTDTTKIKLTGTVIAENDTTEIIDTVKIPEIQTLYIIQVGAFSSMERAQSFINANQQKIEFQMILQQNEKTRLFVVQLQPFITRESAETVRNKIRQIPAFKDSFIITTEE